jgi:hypothetical protein
VEEPAKQISSAYLGQLTLAHDRRTAGALGRLKPECPVWAMLVVMLDVQLEHLLQVPAPNDQQPVQALGADRANPPLRECDLFLTRKFTGDWADGADPSR